MAILGDIAQRTADAELRSWGEVVDAAGVARVAVAELRVSCRVPDDFLRLAATVAPAGTTLQPRGVREARWPAVAVRASADALPLEHISGGADLLGLQEVKGLEFDAVLVVDPAAILAERPDGGAGGLCTALTRSTRALAIVRAAPLPDALAAAPELRHQDRAAALAGWTP